ncbi:katanin p80 WD40 repeat-containing subunit B1-like [Uloborus diversus]|uniref:katanin p80 WD40 repeat-containing subunit B1-like n=1 Tax=Uloborus diversus TaxID=327109 RepID=UPI0024098806|nr:katanin p80 WD40 repeat-containing subunit B1-like [Uloborus diversus]
MRCVSPARRIPESIFCVEKRRQENPEWREAAYSVRWEEFVAHGASVTCLTLGRKSGRVLVTGGEDKKVNLWAVGKSNCIMSLSGHTSSIECVKFGPCEDIVCAGSSSGSLKIWDLDPAKIIRTLLGHKSKVNCLDFHPYGDFVASGSSDNNIKLWDKRRKGSIFTYKGHNSPVHSLKFSPDGRWIASGSEDGVIKLWDLPAGKMRTEFHGHKAAVTDIEFHPNELLLASCSNDQFVKFWDMENYRIVSSSDGDIGPVQKIYFSPDGGCLFSGAQDILKVYAWEPIRTLDTLVMGWGKVSDIATAENQLIVGAFSLTNVSVYIMDLKKVQSFDSWIKECSMIRTSGTDSSSYDEEPAVFDEESSQLVDCRGNYLSHFQTATIDGTSILTEEDLSKTHVLGLELATFLPPLEDSPTKNLFNCTYKVTKGLQGRVLPTAVAHPYSYERDKLLEGEEKELEVIQFPELELMQQSRSYTAIELDDFLPRNLLEDARGGALEISDAEAISCIYRGHESMTHVLGHRKKHLQSVFRTWKLQGPLAGLSMAVCMSDTAILVDILTLLISRPSTWTLDFCQLLLPVICDLLRSKYETYVTIGCMSLKLIIKNFAHVIKVNITAPKSIGIDISREERYKKCRTCFSHLMSLRSIVLQRQSSEGQLGKLFTELYEMLRSLEI